MTEEKKAIKAVVKKAFAPLMEKYRLKILDAYSQSVFTSLSLVNDTTGIYIYWESRESYLSIDITRLDDGVMRDYPVSITPDQETNFYLIDDLLSLRNAHAHDIDLVGCDSVSSEKFIKALTTYSSLLDMHASDVLSGDFSIWPRLEEILQERARQLGVTGDTE